MTQIPAEEVTYHSMSFCDPHGRLFWWQDQLLRGISPERAEATRTLFEDGTVSRCVEAGLIVETELTDFVLDSFPLILRHKPLPFVSYANEWCPEMLRDAGLQNAALAEVLAERGCRFNDATTWNTLFDGPTPVFVDFNSIDASGRPPTPENYTREFTLFYTAPLRASALGYSRLARLVLGHYESNVVHPELATLLQKKTEDDGILGKLGRRIITSLRGGTPSPEALAAELANIALPNRPRADVTSLEPVNTWSTKRRIVHRVLNETNPARVIDLGAGDGWYSRLAASLGARVVATDVDEGKVATCYQAAQEGNHSILSLVMDIRYPTPGQGVELRVLPPATERLKSEFVLALGILDELREQHLTLEMACEALISFSTNRMLVEVKQDRDVTIAALEHYFSSVSPLPDEGDTFFILCENVRH
jgi:hypothetical protein